MSMNVQPTKWTRNTPRLMVSRYRGKCEVCGNKILRGQTIVWSKANGARHPKCAGVEVPAGWAEHDFLEKIAAVAVPALVTAAPLAGEVVAFVAPAVVALVDEPPAVPDEWWDLIAAEDPAL